MSFQIKDFVSIVLGQINHARGVTDKVTDFQPGSVVRTIMESPAVEIEELYLQMFLGLRDAIPVATFLSFGLDRLPQSVAMGFVSVSSTSPMVQDLTVPAGTRFEATDGRAYYSTASVVWASGASLVRIPVAYTSAGAIGNAAAGSITVSQLFTGANYTVSNSSISTGRDEETDTEREGRFQEFVRALSRGTVFACLYAARQSRVLDADGNIFEYVMRAGLVEVPGRVSIYLYSNLGIPSAELLAAGRLAMEGSRNEDTGAITPGYRPAGVRVDVLPMVERVVPMSIKVDMQPGYLLTPAVEQKIDDIFSAVIRSVQPGTTLYLGTLIENMLAAEGVEQIVPDGNSNILCAESEALIPGLLTVAPL